MVPLQAILHTYTSCKEEYLIFKTLNMPNLGSNGTQFISYNILDLNKSNSNSLIMSSLPTLGISLTLMFLTSVRI